MNYFEINKYQSIHENIPYIASQVYNILSSTGELNNIFDLYVKKHKISKGINIEKNIKLSIIFLYSIGMIEYNDDIIKKVK